MEMERIVAQQVTSKTEYNISNQISNSKVHAWLYRSRISNKQRYSIVESQFPPPKRRVIVSSRDHLNKTEPQILRSSHPIFVITLSALIYHSVSSSASTTDSPRENMLHRTSASFTNTKLPADFLEIINPKIQDDIFLPVTGTSTRSRTHMTFTTPFTCLLGQSAVRLDPVTPCNHFKPFRAITVAAGRRRDVTHFPFTGTFNRTEEWFAMIERNQLNPNNNNVGNTTVTVVYTVFVCRGLNQIDGDGRRWCVTLFWYLLLVDSNRADSANARASEALTRRRR